MASIIQTLPSNTTDPYIKTIMSHIENNEKYGYIRPETNKILSNYEQNSSERRKLGEVLQSLNSKEINNKKKEINISINKQITIAPVREITYDSYIDSNILKLLYFLKSYEKNIKIVCHSYLMQDLLNIQILNNFNSIKTVNQKKNILEIENNENIWSIILNSGKYCITRHAFAIGNFNKENSKKSWFSALQNFKQVSDNDTKLSLYGILGSLNFDNTEINLNDCDNTVFVSILVRTWITAICLYLPKIGEYKEFTLVVSPFIKEFGDTNDNTPLPIDKQINIVKNFLRFLRNIDTTYVSEKCKTSIEKIKKFFNDNGELVINGEKIVISGKNKLLKHVKYTIKYDTRKKCFNIKKTNTENFFKRLTSLNSSQYILDIKNLKVLPGLRKPTNLMIKNIKINKEPSNKNNKNNCILYPSDIQIGIIDIDEEGKEFTPDEIEKFYKSNKPFLQSLNVLIVCTQRSLSQGNTKHFQHLLKELFIETNNTNFNLKKKENTTQAISFESFSGISGSKFGLRTRVYTQGLDNSNLTVDFNSIDFSLTSSNEGAILCSIKYHGADLVRVLNLYADTNSISNKKNNIKRKIKNKFNILLNGNNVLNKNMNSLKKNVYNSGKSKEIFVESDLLNQNIIYKIFNKSLDQINVSSN